MRGFEVKVLAGIIWLYVGIENIQSYGFAEIISLIQGSDRIGVRFQGRGEFRVQGSRV